jgi:hypothetical protein
MGQGANNCKELTYLDKKSCHSLKYFTWIEQQGLDVKELNNQWYEDNYWENRMSEKIVDMYDSWIKEFNKKTGLGKKYDM